MRKVLITGAGGFLGSHLVESFINKEYEVIAFVRYNSKNNWGWLEDISNKKYIQIIRGDVRDYDSVAEAIKYCDSIIHLAALIGIPYSYVSPLAYIKTNVEGTYNILEAARKNNISNLLITSTSETYGTAQYSPIDENHPLVGQSPYSASKIAADQLSISYFRSFDLPVKIVRPFNIFGPRQSARAIIPTIITQLISGNNVLKLGNISPTRDLTYINDTVNGFEEIFNSDYFIGQITNIGMNTEISVKDLSLKIASLMDKDIIFTLDQIRERPLKSEVENLRCNNEKLTNNSNWKPKYSLAEGLRDTIEWFTKNIHYYKSEIYNF